MPAEWLQCRRCGAPLQSGPDADRVTIPATMHRRRAVAGGVVGVVGVTTPSRPAPTSAALAAAAAARSGPADTLLPGALPRPDHLLPRPVRGASAAKSPASATAFVSVDDFGTRRPAPPRVSVRTHVRTYVHAHWRRILVIAIVAVALTLSLTAVWPVLFSSGAKNTPFPAASTAREAVATDLLRTVAGGGRTMYAPGKVYPPVTPDALSSFSYNVPIVGPRTTATAGHVSMRLNSAQVLTLATPADAERCVFARDEPARGKTRFATVRTTDCRAISAPAKGWHTR